MNDLIDRQVAINTVNTMMERCTTNDIHDLHDLIVESLTMLPSAQPEQTKMIKEIRKWINSGNRGSADYFIVDKIEEIIDEYER